MVAGVFRRERLDQRACESVLPLRRVNYWSRQSAQEDKTLCFQPQLRGPTFITPSESVG